MLKKKQVHQNLKPIILETYLEAKIRCQKFLLPDTIS